MNANQKIDKFLAHCAPSIIRCDNITSLKDKSNWKCTICSYLWNASVCNIRYYNPVCPQCTNKGKFSNQKVDLFFTTNDIKIKRCDEIINSQIPCTFTCLVCSHRWKTRPTKILKGGTRCPKCANKINLTNDQVDKRLEDKKLTIKRIGSYINTHTKIQWQCTKCNNLWYAKPSNILNEHTGCPHCRTPSYSKKAIKWLTQVEKQDSIIIKHAENGGEYLIPGTKLKVDGFCEQTHTIYEFYGDMYHGNPTKYKSQEQCCPFHKLTAGELFNRTVQKETIIKELGYNLITIWENEYDK